MIKPSEHTVNVSLLLEKLINNTIDLACRRIAWGKFLNAGQTYIAPDYILVEKSIKDKVLEALKNIQIKYCFTRVGEV